MPSNQKKRNNKKKKKQPTEPQSRALALKDKGNQCFQMGDIQQAIKYYTEALEEDSENHLILSNRAMCHGKLKNFALMLEDANKCVALSPNWPKGYLRRGNALEGLMKFTEAHNAFKAGLKLDPSNPDLNEACQCSEKRVSELDYDENKAVGGLHEQTDKFKVFLRWLIDGGCIFPKLYLKFYSPEYRAVRALHKIALEEEILYVPHDMIMTSDLAKKSEIGQAIIKARIELRSKHTYLAAFLLQEREAQSTKWKPYLDILPQEYNTVPLFFKEECEKELKGSIAIKKMQARIESLQAEYNNLCEHVPQFARFPHKDFVWARLVVITRIFGLVIDGVKTDGLVPMADMLNHRRPRETKWTYDQNKQGFVISALQHIKQDAEIFDSYGRKCNSRFFVNYGFSLEHNPDNEARMEFVLPSTYPQFSMKVLMLGETMDEEGVTREFQIPMNYKEKKVKACFSFLRLMNAKEKEMLLLTEDTDLDDILPISVKNEQLSLLALSKAAKASLDLFDHTLEHDQALLADTENYPFMSNKRNIVLMRRGEKEVLHFYKDLAKTCIPMFRMQWKDLKKVASKYKDDDDPLGNYIKSVVVPLVKRG